jgi:proline iminopeptidase
MIQSFYHLVNGQSLALSFAGNPQGIPVLFLHGGPGAGCKREHLTYFDLDRYWVVLWDQRGSGRSLPFGTLTDNTTQDLLADMESLRQLFGVERWLLFGGSWGSYLALSYALHYPERVSGMVLRSICLGRQQEHDWLYHFGANQLFPEAWQDFLTFIPKEEQSDLLTAYYHRLMASDFQLQWQAAWHWSCWAMACLQLAIPCEPQTVSERRLWIAQVRIELHYFYHQLFSPKHFVVDSLSKINTIPLSIVHGAHDFLCPPNNAVTLHQKMPNSQLTLVAHAGHLSSAAGMFEALKAALAWVTAL